VSDREHVCVRIVFLENTFFNPTVSQKFTRTHNMSLFYWAKISNIIVLLDIIISVVCSKKNTPAI